MITIKLTNEQEHFIQLVRKQTPEAEAEVQAILENWSATECLKMASLLRAIARQLSGADLREVYQRHDYESN